MYVDISEEYIWVIPGLLLFVSILAAISIVGVVLAWKGKSGTLFQHGMSYVVLPLLLLATIICWIVMVVLSLSTMIGTGTYDDLYLYSFTVIDLFH